MFWFKAFSCFRTRFVCENKFISNATNIHICINLIIAIIVKQVVAIKIAWNHVHCNQHDKLKVFSHLCTPQMRGICTIMPKQLDENCIYCMYVDVLLFCALNIVGFALFLIKPLSSLIRQSEV